MLVILKRQDKEGYVTESEHIIVGAMLDKVCLKPTEEELGGARWYKLHKNTKGYYVSSTRVKTYITGAIFEFTRELLRGF